MLRKYLKERREKNRLLAERDAANRCTHCRKVMAKVDVLGGFRFCSWDCREAAMEFIDKFCDERKGK